MTEKTDNRSAYGMNNKKRNCIVDVQMLDNTDIKRVATPVSGPMVAGCSFYDICIS